MHLALYSSDHRRAMLSSLYMLQVFYNMAGLTGLKNSWNGVYPGG